jgi:hypothetical protein
MQSHPAAQEPPPAPDPPADHAQPYLQILHELLAIGTEVARTIGAQARAQNQAQAAPDSEPAPDLTIPFDRIARAIRRTIVLARKLAEPQLAQSAQPAPHRIAARKRILREVEDAIQRKARDAEAASLQTELLERLDSPDLDEEIDHRPTAEIIADICRDLGIAHPPGSHPWKRRTPADIAELRARAAQAWATTDPVLQQPPPNAPSGRAGAGAALPDRAAA